MAGRLRFLEADAQCLPFPDDYFQISTVGFGLRNVADTDRGIAEMVRVTAPGGKVAILEFSQPRGWLFGGLYRFYFRRVLPLIGQVISRSRDSAYRYLPQSVLEFPDGEALAGRLRCAWPGGGDLARADPGHRDALCWHEARPRENSLKV